jgi:hypothetical protein
VASYEAPSFDTSDAAESYDSFADTSESFGSDGDADGYLDGGDVVWDDTLEA